MFCPETDQWQKSICEEGAFSVNSKGPSSCEPGQIICGITTHVWMGGGDLTGVGSVFMKCCTKPYTSPTL